MTRGAFVERLENWKKYFTGANWEKAFAALEKLSPVTPDGVTKIMGDELRIIVMSYSTKPEAEAVIESHENFLDIQMLLTGRETFRWWPVKGLKVSQPYDAAKDIAFYQPAGPLAEFAATPGYFAVFLPGDAHSTGIHPAGLSSPQACRKAVVKMRMSLT
jgi:biofilm protein TabA